MLDNREMLRHRQLSVLSDLLAGKVPHGFDDHTSFNVGERLRAKRLSAAADEASWLTELPGWEQEFERFAQLHTLQCCAKCDVKEFREYAYEIPHLRDWVMDREVAEGLRRVAWVHRDGRREVQISFGDKLRRMALRRSRPEAPAPLPVHDVTPVALSVGE